MNPAPARRAILVPMPRGGQSDYLTVLGDEEVQIPEDPVLRDSQE